MTVIINDQHVEVATKYPVYRRDSIRALRHLGDPAGIDYLGGILLDTNELELNRILAAWALGATMDDKAFPCMKKALDGAEGKLADEIITAMTEFRPALSFPVLVASMDKMGILDGNSNDRRDLGKAWLRLHECSGYLDVVAQYTKDKSKLQVGMKDYWEGRRRLWELARRIQHCRYVEPDPAKEDAARRELESAAKAMRTGGFGPREGPAIPAPRRADAATRPASAPATGP